MWDLEGKKGDAPLMCFQGHPDDIRCIGWFGVDLNQTDQTGITPLMTAAESGLVDVVKVLLQCVEIDAWIGDRCDYVYVYVYMYVIMCMCMCICM